MIPIPEAAMNLRQTVAVICLGLGLLSVVLYFVRARQLRERYCMLYVFISVALASVPLLYHPLQRVAGFMGILNMNSFFFFLAILGLCLICLQLSLALSTAYGQRKALAQQVALLEKRVRSMEGPTAKPGPEPEGA